jgi:hypothetical protein
MTKVHSAPGMPHEKSSTVTPVQGPGMDLVLRNGFVQPTFVLGSSAVSSRTDDRSILLDAPQRAKRNGVSVEALC